MHKYSLLREGIWVPDPRFMIQHILGSGQEPVSFTGSPDDSDAGGSRTTVWETPCWGLPGRGSWTTLPQAGCLLTGREARWPGRLSPGRGLPFSMWAVQNEPCSCHTGPGPLAGRHFSFPPPLCKEENMLASRWIRLMLEGCRLSRGDGLCHKLVGVSLEFYLVMLSFRVIWVSF